MKIFLAVLFAIAVLPLLYATIRGLGASLHLQREASSKLSHRQRMLLLLLVASELVFVGAGFGIGYATAGSRDPVAVGVVAAFGGGCAWVVLCWLVGGFIRNRRSRTQRQGVAPSPH